MSYQSITVDSNISFSWPIPWTGEILIADINDFTASAANWAMMLPPASYGNLGNNFIFNNIGNYSCTLVNYGSSEEVGEITPGSSVKVYLKSNSDNVGQWGIINYNNSFVGLTNIGLNSTDDSLVISGDNNPITPPGGSLNFALSSSLKNLNSISNSESTGLLVLQKNTSPYWNTVTLVGGSNININIPDGSAGNPTINLVSNLTNLSSISVVDVANNNINITPTSLVITGQTNSCMITSNGLTVNGTQSIPSYAAKAFVCFADTGSGCDSAITLQDTLNVDSVTGAAGVYTINFTFPFVSATYAVLTSLQRGSSTLLPYQVFVQVKQTTSLTIACVDTMGNLLAPIDGVSVVVFSNPSS